MQLDWHKLARSHIAPRTADDIALSDDRWKLRDWPDIYKRFTVRSVQSTDDSITAAIDRVRAAQSGLRDIEPLELEVIFAICGVRQVWEYFRARRRAPETAVTLASLSLESGWDTATSAYVITRKPPRVEAMLLRRHIVREQPAAREECRQALEGRWAEGDVDVRVALAYAFFEHEPWRKEALAAVLEQAPPLTDEQLTLPRDAETMRTLVARRKPDQAIEYTEIVASLGEGALPVILELAKTARKRLHLSHTLATSVFVAEEAAQHLASCISHPQTRDLIGGYFERHKDLASKVLPAASQGASRNAALAKALLIKVCGPVETVATEHTVSLDDPAVPAVLRDAPWRNPPPGLPAIDVDLEAYPLRVELSEGRQTAGASWWVQAQRNQPEMTPDEVKAYLAKLGSSYLWRVADEGKAIPRETLLSLFCAGKLSNTSTAVPLLAVFGVRALPGLRNPRMLLELPLDVLERIEDPHLAATLAAASLTGHLGWSLWSRTFPRAAVTGLLATVHLPETRRTAEIMLRRMAAEGRGDLILAVAKNHPHVAAFLSRDPRLDVAVVPAIAKVPVTRPRLRDGRALGDDVIERVLEMLALSHVDAPYAGLEDVRAACEPRSLGEMVWDLAALADGGGRASRSQAYPDWMRHAVAHFGDDTVIRRLTPALKHPQIYRVLEALTQRGVRSAAMELATAYERGDAPQSMERVATAMNRSVDELVETIVPTTALEDDGTTVLQHGARTLRVGFDTTLAPILFDGETRLAALPRARKDDDPIALRLARERWEELKEDVRTIAHLRARSLENAMRTGQHMPAARFLAGWVAHPLGKHAARAIVWAAERDGALVTFRVADDGTFADAHDEVLTLDPGELVHVPHPAELPRETVDAWLRIFGDYGLIQPVVQLARTPMALGPGEAETASVIERAVDRPILWHTVTRVLREQGTHARALTRCEGVAHFDLDTKWAGRQSLVKNIKLSFRLQNSRDNIPLSRVDPVERDESLYVMRLLLEG